MNVAIYARVSTEEQARKYSIPAQLDLLRSFAKTNSHDVFKEYLDKGKSGAISERPQLQELLSDARKGMFKAVIVYKTDRFFRNTRKLLNTVDELNRLGVAFKSVTEPFDTSNPVGSFMFSLLGSVAQLERDTFIQRTRMGMVKSIKSGNIITGCARYGYTYNREKLCYEIDDEEAKVVREIFRLYEQSNSSLVKVTNKLNQLGYRIRNGAKWTTARLHKILVSNIYCGKWCYQTKYNSKPITVGVPPLVDSGVFDRVQKLLKERRLYSKRNTKNEYLLSHLLFCGVCGRSLAARSGRMKHSSGGKVYGPYIKSYYYCFGRLSKKCGLPFVRVDRIDSLVWSRVEEILENPSLLMKLIKERDKTEKGQNGSLAKSLGDAGVKVQKCEQEKDNLIRAFRKGIIDDAEFTSQIGEIRQEEQALRQKQEEIKLQIQRQKEMKKRLEHLGHLIDGMKQKLDNLTFEEKRDLLRTLIDKVTVHEDGKVELRVVVPEVMPSTDNKKNDVGLAFVGSRFSAANSYKYV